MKKLFVMAVALAWGNLLTDYTQMKAQNAGSNASDTKIIVYGMGQQVLRTVNSNEGDSIVFTEAAPIADMLDVVFHADGAAEEISPMQNTVEQVGTGTYTRFSNAYNRYIATFTTTWTSNTSS